MDTSTDVDNILKDLTSGNISADECFCMVLSLVGYDGAKTHFLKHVERLRKTHAKLYNQLYNVYRGYFESIDDSFKFPDKLDCSVENGFYAMDSSENQDTGYDSDLELALKLSLQDTCSISSNPSYASMNPSYASTNPSYASTNPSYASMLMPSQTNIVSLDVNKEKIKKMTFSFNDNNVCNQPGTTDSSKQSELITPIPNTADEAGKGKKKRNKKKNRIDRPLSNPPVVYWFRRDLRLYDNPALVYAAQLGAPVIPVFLWSDKEEGPDKTLANGGATKYWLHMALPTLNKDMINHYNNPITFRKSTDYSTDILDIIKQSGAQTLVMNDVYEPYLKQRDDRICKALKSKGVTCERFHSYLLHQPGAIKTEALCMRGMGSVTHFMECCRQSDPEPLGTPVDPPNSLPVGAYRPDSIPVSELGLGKLPKRKDGTEV